MSALVKMAHRISRYPSNSLLESHLMRASRAYVGHAEGWDELTIDGGMEARDCLLRYERCGSVLAVASIYREIWRPN
jgi:hypothetical protein